MGSCGSSRLRLCNPHPHPVVCVISPVVLPFVCTHERVRIKGRSYVMVPVKVVPVGGRRWERVVRVRTEGGEEAVALVTVEVE